MTLPIGTRVGPYEVLAPLGAGGMGEVYRAKDSRLGREVALKLLPDEFARDPERLARFGREAQILAALNHPHIATLHGLEESGGAPCLVMELVPGQTLAERVAAGPVPVREALEIARQIAEALEAAHERGIIHRDLKPANVKVTPDGTVKVLDFGLAKAIEISAAPAADIGPAAAAGAAGDAGRSPAPPLSQSPTLTLGATARGVILGTAAYMSPEQARGAPLDRRTDIWSFGCVLYDLLTGRVAFAGHMISDTLAAVLKTEPDWSALPADTPTAIRGLLHRCLVKESRRRLRDIGDARIEIEEVLSRPAGAAAVEPGEAGGRLTSAPSVVRAARSLRVAWGVAGLMAVIAGLSLWSVWSERRAPGAMGPTVRMEMTLPLSDSLVLGEGISLALAPDGSRLVYLGRRGGVAQLFSRRLDRHGAEPIPGTEHGFAPFFSPDSRWVGFVDWGGRKLNKVPLDGGAVETLLQGVQVTSASWGADGTIVFTTWPEGYVMRLPAAGGAPQLVAAPDRDALERFISPVQVPGGEAVIATVLSASLTRRRIAAFSLQGGEGQAQAKTLVEGVTFARFVPPGTLVFARPDGDLLAAPFDPARLEISGTPALILRGVSVDSWGGEAQLDVAGEGALAYVPRPAAGAKRTLVWVDRKGVERVVTDAQHEYVDPNLSPDGRRLAVAVGGPNQDLWIHDLERDTLTRATFGPDADMAPVWSPDGRRLVYCVGAAQAALFWRPADGSGKEEQVVQSETPMFPVSWSGDGRTIAVWALGGETGSDILLVRLGETVKVEKFLATPFGEWHPQFSPDAKWIAYTSNESGRYEVYVQASSGSGGKWQISADGGHEPRWARNGRELSTAAAKR